MAVLHRAVILDVLGALFRNLWHLISSLSSCSTPNAASLSETRSPFMGHSAHLSVGPSASRPRRAEEARHVRRVGLERGGVLALEPAERLEHNLAGGHAPDRRGAAADERERTEEA